jgi:hypothetical protein
MEASDYSSLSLANCVAAARIAPPASRTCETPLPRSALGALHPFGAVYFLHLVDAATGEVRARARGARSHYKGCAVDLTRRLRQHNRVISGGARATRLSGGRDGLVWRHVLVCTGFRGAAESGRRSDRSEALAFETCAKRARRQADDWRWTDRLAGPPERVPVALRGILNALCWPQWRHVSVHWLREDARPRTVDGAPLLPPGPGRGPREFVVEAGSREKLYAVRSRQRAWRLAPNRPRATTPGPPGSREAPIEVT